jgi:Xaa-Pro aminopeptidase
VTANDNTSQVAKRSGSEKRQRGQTIAVRCDAAEFLLIDAKARMAGLSRSSYARTVLLGSPGPRARRAPHVNAEALARATAALNKIGANLNQVVHDWHVGRIPGAREAIETLEEVRAAAAEIRKITGRKRQK